MSSFEKEIKCTNCSWQGRRVIEKPHVNGNSFEEVTSLLAISLQKSDACPQCGSVTTPSTKILVS